MSKLILDLDTELQHRQALPFDQRLQRLERDLLLLQATMEKLLLHVADRLAEEALQSIEHD